jgi:hypothetical protein
MKRVIVLICFILLICGCDTTKTITETENTETTREITRREPYPIMRTYENKNGYIEFTDTSSSIELTRIYYNNYNASTGVGIEDSLNLRVPAGNTGNIVTIQVRSKQYKWTCYDNNPHSVVFYMKADTEWPDMRYLGLTEDVLSADNDYDFVRVFVNNVLYEMYYIADFEETI